MKKTGEDISKEIVQALTEGRHSLVLTGIYEIFHTVYLPNEFTLVLNDCELRMVDGTMEPMLCNAGLQARRMNAVQPDSGIRIIGIGHAVLNGGTYNGLSERNANKDGLPPIWSNNILLLVNVSGFEIRNLQVRNQRWWAFNLLSCNRGTIRDIDFCADDSWIDASGQVMHGLERSHYDEIVVKNADGIDLRSGCHDILIENITGFCEDDMVALTNLYHNLERTFSVTDGTRDIYNIAIRNIRGSSYCTMVRLLNQSGARMYNILIDGVFDDSADSLHMTQGLYGVRVGDTHLYGDVQPQAEDTDRITIQNIYSRATYAVDLSGKMQHVLLHNIVPFDQCKGDVQRREE